MFDIDFYMKSFDFMQEARKGNIKDKNQAFDFCAPGRQ